MPVRNEPGRSVRTCQISPSVVVKIEPDCVPATNTPFAPATPVNAAGGLAGRKFQSTPFVEKNAPPDVLTATNDPFAYVTLVSGSEKGASLPVAQSTPFDEITETPTS